MAETQTARTYHQDPIEWLRSEFNRRRSRNSSYSLRAFARHLALSSGTLSELLQRKRPLTAKQGERIAQRLGYSPTERLVFLGAIKQRHAAEEAGEVEVHFRALDEEKFQIVADWYHYALRELIETVGFRDDHHWIAKRLGISPSEVKDALARLEKIGTIQKQNGRWTNSGSVTTSHDIPSLALKQFHHQSLNHALEALEEVPLHARDITSITMAIDTTQIAEAKAQIKQFRRRMAQLLETGDRTEVYQLSIQLVPLTHSEKTNA